MKVNYFFKVVKADVTGFRAWKHSDTGVSEPGNRCDKDDPVDHSSLDVFLHAIGDDDESGDGEPEGGALHAAVEAEDVAGDGATGD